MNMNQGMLVPEIFKRDKLRITKEQLSFEFCYRRERDIFFFLIQIEKILFFSSSDVFSYRAFEYLKKGGDISKLEQKKKVFREPKKSNEMDKVLRDYSRAAKDCGGILFR